MLFCHECFVCLTALFDCLGQNFNQYCEMVDKSKALDIDGSMAQHEWSTEEFNHVLPTFTEMVEFPSVS